MVKIKSRTISAISDCKVDNGKSNVKMYKCASGISDRKINNGESILIIYFSYVGPRIGQW